MRPIIQNRYSHVDIQEINALAQHKPMALVMQGEQYYRQQLTDAASLIRKALPKYAVILLSGPSASGKTTTAHKLRQQLTEQGVHAWVLSMDNFYMGIEQYPLLPDGSRDMESIQAIDLQLLNACFEELLEKGKADFPMFDFVTQTQHLKAHPIHLETNDVLIMEGIHALNPSVLGNIPQENIFRMYVSVRTKFVCGEEIILEPKEIRLIRRMVRDYKFRNYAPEQTLQYWKYVVEGERVNIDPYRDAVHFKMDSTLDYEVCVWHSMLHYVIDSAELSGMLRAYPELEGIVHALKRFTEMDIRCIPSASLLHEFIG